MDQNCECQTSESQCGFSHADMLFFLAKKAKMELIKEKMKKHLEAADGTRYDKAAKLVVDALVAHRENRMESAEKWESFQKELDELWD